MDEYVENCKNMDMIDWLDSMGNDEYKNDRQQNLVDEDILRDYYKKGIMYVYNYFDVLTWWRVNAGKYNELSVAATIVLGKPTHNAFQERVFSMGTHKDTRLRNRLKEDGFEMSVLNAVNNKDLISKEETIKIIGKDLKRFAEEQKSIQII
jgi:hAT family C-terminal dimerisation region